MNLPFAGFKTFFAAIVTIVLGGGFIIDDPSDTKAWVIAIVGLLMAGLRAVTSTPPGKGTGA